MFDAFIDGLFLVLQWKAFSLMLVGMGLGFCVGLLPGIGGAATLALMIPFIFKMSPAEAFAFLLGMHSVAATTGDITSVLFGVPGEAISAATVVDGYPMAKRGEAGRALGAALMSSLLSGRNPEAKKLRRSAMVAPHMNAGDIAAFRALPWNSGMAEYRTSSAEKRDTGRRRADPWESRTAFGRPVEPEVKINR